jgi:hypothetical protein
VYEGHTGWQFVQEAAKQRKKTADRLSPAAGDREVSGLKDKSLGKLSRGDRRCMFPNDRSAESLFQAAIAWHWDFSRADFFAVAADHQQE